ncbi:autotransporter domain-containing protein [Ensifer sp. YR511]|uniref:autotransporter domain-containing protein n=1 Tax=Ensifer sp. YR511 TaxID=1855294 RepID=UPI00088EEF71|nr:autotransporter domain-containing protein [Ensifer sp. YR511]SDN97211.1 hypothetical protein SAMN05216328_14515 [Ensifer sp. YR511]
MLNLGADYLLWDKALVGLSFHSDRMTDPTDEDAELTGKGWLAGPNASLEIGKGVFWDTSLLYGGSANDIDTTRWMVDTAINGQWNLDQATVLTPKLRAVYFSETVDEYTVRNGAGDKITINLTAGVSLATADLWLLDLGLLFNIEGDGEKSVVGRARASRQF